MNVSFESIHLLSVDFQFKESYQGKEYQYVYAGDEEPDKDSDWDSRLQKYPNTEFFRVRIFVHSDWIRTRKKSVFGHFSQS